MRPIRLLALAASLALGTLAQAADFYGEFHVGTTRGALDAVGAERVEGAYGIGIGVKHNAWFSTQLDWHTLGENADLPPSACTPTPCVADQPLPEHAWVLRAIPRLPLGERFAIELGLGLAMWEGDRTVAGTRSTAEGEDLLWSLGVELRLADRLALTLERQDHAIDGVSFDWTGATLRYRF